MKNYEAMTVGNLIDWLEQQDPTATINGLSADSDSYRGYYEHVAIAPSNDGVTVADLLAELTSKINTTMHGYKGGEYTYQTDCYVFVADHGDTGGFLAGFDGLEPVVVEQGWF